MTVLWADMVPGIAGRAPDLPRFTGAEAFQRECVTFYRVTRAWRVRGVALASTVVGQSVYTVTNNPAGASLCGLPAVWIGTQEGKELPTGKADDYLSTDTSATPFVGVAGPASIILAPFPSSAGVAITATAAYEPASNATGLDDALWAAHREAIEAAVLARLKAQTNKPWSAPMEVMYWEGEANRLALQASTEAGPTRRRASLRVEPL